MESLNDDDLIGVDGDLASNSIGDEMIPGTFDYSYSESSARRCTTNLLFNSTILLVFLRIMQLI